MVITRKYIAALAVLLGACSYHSDAYTTYNLGKKFTGRTVNEFFNEYGFPEARFERNNGSTTYEWASTGLHSHPPVASPHTYYSDKGTYQVVENTSLKE